MVEPGDQDQPADVGDAVDDRLIRGFGVLLEVTARLERLAAVALERELGISHVMFEVLLRLAGAPDRRLPVGELGRLLVVTSGGATRLVSRMERQGLVSRRARPDDRRVQMVELTGDGAEVLRRAATLHAANLQEYLGAPLSEEELTSLLSSLDRLGAALRVHLPYLR